MKKKRRLANSNYALTNEAIHSVLSPFGFSLSAELTAGIGRYIGLLQTWNKHISLTAIVDTKEILERHFGESLFAVHAVPIAQGRLADVGSGAGFPGMPIKMACPQVEVTLIESNARKATFLCEVIRALGLKGISVVNRRMEDTASLIDSLDYVTARALGDIPRLLAWSRSSLRKRGRVVLWLGQEDAREFLSVQRAWAWHQPIRIPRSQNRVLLIGDKEG